VAHKDIKKIANEILEYKAKFGARYPAIAQAFACLKEDVMRDGTVLAKQKELIAVGIAVGMRCTPCIYAHTSNALRLGATPIEILDAATVAILMAGGSGMAYIVEVMRAIEAFTE
jgi:AhpD family alkylhydroperoxidase